MVALLLPVLLALGAEGANADAAPGFAVILESGPEQARDRAAEARTKRPPIAAATLVAGYPRIVGTREVAELKPGSWAFVAGICATRVEANAALDRLRRDGYAGAYLKPTAAAAPASCPAPRPEWDRAEALFTAAGTGARARVRELVRAGADVNHVTSGGMTALGAAAYAGEQAIVKALLAAGAKPDGRGAGSQDETPLTLVARSQAAAAPEQVARLLIARGADVNATTDGAEADRGTSPLTEALAGCRPALVRLLLAKGARVVIDGARERCGTAAIPAPAELRELLARTKLELR